MSGIIRFDAKVLLTDRTYEFFHSSMADHMNFEGTRSSPIRPTDIAFVTLFARMGFERRSLKRN